MKKWTDAEIKKLIKKKNAGSTVAELAELHGVSTSRISQLLSTFKRRAERAEREQNRYLAIALEHDTLRCVLTKLAHKHPHEVIEAYVRDAINKANYLRSAR